MPFAAEHEDALDLPGRGRLVVRRWDGPAGAATLVLLHGWTATAELNWAPSIPALAERFSVVAMDLRGHGRGLPAGGSFSLEACADDVVAVADALALSSVVAVGYSMGGAVAQLAWRRHPRRVAGLVLCATAAWFPSRTPYFSAGLAAASLLLSPTSAMSPALRAQAATRLLRPWATVDRRLAQGTDPLAVVRAGRALGAFDSRPWLGRLDVPAASVVTTLDRAVPPERQLATARLAGATVHEVAADHRACVNTVDAFVPALLGACGDVTSADPGAGTSGPPPEAVSR